MTDNHISYNEDFTVIITAALDAGLTYLSSSSDAAVSINDDGEMVLIRIPEDASRHFSGSVRFAVGGTYML